MSITTTRVASAFIGAALVYATVFIPIPAHATMLGPCDHLNSWSTLRVGDKDTNISDIGPIAGLQQMIGEPDVVHTMPHYEDGHGFSFQNGVFDTETKELLIAWQLKHGIIASRSDAETGVVGEKTLAVAKNYCAGGSLGSGAIMSGPTLTYTFYFPQKGGGFGSVTSYPMPKYTSRVADQALRALLSFSGVYGSSVCNDPKIGNGCFSMTKDGRYVAEGSSEYMFAPFSSYELGKNGYQVRDINGKDVYLTNGYRGVTIENGIATVSFNQVALPFFDNAAVSSLVRGSIERTLKQFPTISQVRFKVISFHDAAPPSERVFGESGASEGTDVASKITALLAQIKTLQDLIAALRGQPTTPTIGTSSCLDLNNSLVIGSTDATTNGEVSKLQRFLGTYIVSVMDPNTVGDSGFLPDELAKYRQPVTGYYGRKTAENVMQWQKAHGMDFVTTKSGVGPMTREKMMCSI